MIIRAHSVPIGEDTGLSPMQDSLLNSDRPVRLVSAPTGTGKTYAFMQAVLARRAHVLFIVPTRRLLQNLMLGAQEETTQHFHKLGWTGLQIAEWLEENVIEWSGNQAAPVVENLRARRTRQLLSSGGTQGRILFAIPEVVVQMVAGVPIKGASTITPFTFLRSFDHVVLDEFHTIDDRSFGLACLLAQLAVSEGRGKLSLLSATPIDVTGILEKVGVTPEQLDVIVEAVEPGHSPSQRPIHGDVTVTTVDCALLESVSNQLVAVRTSIEEGGTVIVIFDSLRDLKREESRLRGILGEAGIPDNKILSINSLDDSERHPGQSRRGRNYADPREYEVLLCTSAVEVGVTFHSTLMFMDPGFNLAGFVQRVGRVARGSADGQVWVCLSPRRRERDRWIRDMSEILSGQEGMDVETFTASLLRAEKQRREPSRRELAWDPEEKGEPPSFYRRLSWRGVFWAGLFRTALFRKMKVQKGALTRLKEMNPPLFRYVNKQIWDILAVERVNEFLPISIQPHKKWVEALFQSALNYRDIGATIEVVDPDGNSHTVTEAFLRRATTLLSRYILHEGDNGQFIQLNSRTLRQELEDDEGGRPPLDITWYILSPLDQQAFPLPLTEREIRTHAVYSRLVSTWKRHFEKYLISDDVGDPRVIVVKAATALVERLGKPPLDEDYDDSGESALFA